MDTSLRNKTVFLGYCKNKTQLISITSKEIATHFIYHPLQTRLIVSTTEFIPVEITAGSEFRQHTMETMPGEADIIIITILNSLVNEGFRTFHVFCDDTDIFVLLLYYFD